MTSVLRPLRASLLALTLCVTEIICFLRERGKGRREGSEGEREREKGKEEEEEERGRRQGEERESKRSSPESS